VQELIAEKISNQLFVCHEKAASFYATQDRRLDSATTASEDRKDALATAFEGICVGRDGEIPAIFDSEDDVSCQEDAGLMRPVILGWCEWGTF